MEISQHDNQILKQVGLELKTTKINETITINQRILTLSNDILNRLKLTTIGQYQNELLQWQTEIIQRQIVGAKELVDECDLIREMQLIKNQLTLLDFNTPLGNVYLVQYDYDQTKHKQYLTDNELNEYISQFEPVFDIKTVNQSAIYNQIQKLINQSKK